jgi:hypothetical protein
MASLYISEFNDLPITSNGVMQAAKAASWITDQAVAISGTSAPSNAFNVDTNYVLISSDTNCNIAWTPDGADVVAATTGNFYIAANIKPVMFGVAAGMRVSVIEA